MSAGKQVIVLSIFFLILLTAYSSFGTIIVELYEEEGVPVLAPFIFFVNSTAFVIGNLFAPQCKTSEKWQITLATLTYAFNYCTGYFVINAPLHAKFALSGIGAFVNGIGAAYLYISLGKYIHNVCELFDEIKRKGHFYGLFNTIYSTSTIIGGFVVTFGLHFFSHQNYFLFVTAIALSAFVYSLFFVKDIQGKVEVQAGSKSIVQTIKGTLEYYPKMKDSLGYIFLDGFNVSVSILTMLHLIKQTGNLEEDQTASGEALIIYGIGCTLGGYIGGKLCDIIPIPSAFKIGIWMLSLNCSFTIICSYMQVLPLIYLVCFLWGFLVYFFQASQMVLCSRAFNGSAQSFGVVKQFHSVSLIIYQLLCMASQNSIQIPFLMMFILTFIPITYNGINRLQAASEHTYNCIPDEM